MSMDWRPNGLGFSADPPGFALQIYPELVNGAQTGRWYARVFYLSRHLANPPTEDHGPYSSSHAAASAAEELTVYLDGVARLEAIDA